MAEGTRERVICTALPDSALLSVSIYASAPAGARHIGTSNPFPPCLQPLQQLYQFILTDITGVKLKEYSIAPRFAASKTHPGDYRLGAGRHIVYMKTAWYDSFPFVPFATPSGLLSYLSRQTGVKSTIIVRFSRGFPNLLSFFLIYSSQVFLYLFSLISFCFVGGYSPSLYDILPDPYN
jgi:hypothetical protein